MALPAIADVRRALPDAEIAISARPAIAPLFDLTDLRPRPSTSVPDPRPPSPTSDLRPRGGGTEVVLLLPNSFHSAWTAYRARIPERWGYRTDWRGRLLTRAVAAPSSPVHQIEYYQHLTRELGFAAGPSEPRLTVSAERRSAAEQKLADAGWDRRTTLAALAPGAAYGGAKRWPPASFAALAGDLAADGIQPVIVGSNADRETTNDVVARIPRGGGPAPIDLTGRTDLPTLAAVLSVCRALVTNDSGAMHVGAAVGVPVTAVFGPTDETATQPTGSAHRVLTHDVWCRPCMLRECPIDHRCMRGVSVAAVTHAARRIL